MLWWFMNILDISIVYPIAAIATQSKQYHDVKIEFVEHFVVCRNVIFERAKFNQRR